MAERSEIRTDVDGRVLTLTNLEKELYPSGFTKAEVITYYQQIADTLLPHLRDKCLTRIRFPDGTDKFSFFEKNAPAGCPEWVTRQPVLTSDGLVDYVVCDSRATLIWLANLASLELHVPQWHIASAGGPAEEPIVLPADEPKPREPLADTLVVDLDPGPDLKPVELVRATTLVGGLLATDGLLPLARTSGSKGFQVYAAIAPTRTPSVVAYARQLAQRLVKVAPKLFVATVTPSERVGRVFVDYNQNLAGRNTICCWSLRGKAEPRVSTPVEWDELAGFTRPEDWAFGPTQALARLAQHGDPFAELLAPPHAPPLPPLDAIDGPDTHR